MASGTTPGLNLQRPHTGPIPENHR